jgi:hypothetical protein
MEDASNLSFLPIGIRERAGLFPWSDVFQLRYGLGPRGTHGFVADGILEFFDERVSPGTSPGPCAFFSAVVSLFANLVDAPRSMRGPEVGQGTDGEYGASIWKFDTRSQTLRSIPGRSDTVLRLTECLRLRVQDIDFGAAQITVQFISRHGLPEKSSTRIKVIGGK